MPPIEILASSIFAQCFIVFVVAGILYTMYIKTQETFQQYWALSWGAYSLYLASGGLGFLAAVGNWDIPHFKVITAIIALFFGYVSIIWFLSGAQLILKKRALTVRFLVYSHSAILCLSALLVYLANYLDPERMFFLLTFAMRSAICGVAFIYIAVVLFNRIKHIKGARVFTYCLVVYGVLIQAYTAQGVLGYFGLNLPPYIMGSLGLVDFVIQTVIVFSVVSWILEKEHRQVLATEKQLQDLAWQDALTGLPNRLWLNEKSVPILQTLRNNNKNAALIFIDLDGFKAVNDTNGHAVGDQLLIQVAQILTDSLNADDMACRLGGDEFIWLIIGNDSREDVMQKAHDFRSKLESIKQMDGVEINISCSQGVAWFPHHGLDLETLIRLSDHAMYEAKRKGKAQVVEVVLARTA